MTVPARVDGGGSGRDGRFANRPYDGELGIRRGFAPRRAPLDTFAGTTMRGQVRDWAALRRGVGGSDGGVWVPRVRPLWIPAFAGTTMGGAGRRGVGGGGPPSSALRTGFDRRCRVRCGGRRPRRAPLGSLGVGRRRFAGHHGRAMPVYEGVGIARRWLGSFPVGGAGPRPSLAGLPSWSAAGAASLWMRAGAQVALREPQHLRTGFDAEGSGRTRVGVPLSARRRRPRHLWRGGPDALRSALLGSGFPSPASPARELRLALDGVAPDHHLRFANRPYRVRPLGVADLLLRDPPGEGRRLRRPLPRSSKLVWRNNTPRKCRG